MTRCPFCAYEPGPVLSHRINASEQVVCNHCGSAGPLADTLEAAIVAWGAPGPAKMPDTREMRMLLAFLGAAAESSMDGLAMVEAMRWVMRADEAALAAAMPEGGSDA